MVGNAVKKEPALSYRIVKPGNDAHGVNSLAFIVWHTVEFSRFGRTLKQAVSGRFQGNHAMLAGWIVGCNVGVSPGSVLRTGRSLRLTET